MRDEGPRLLDSIVESIDVGRRARLPVLINHHKATGATQFGWTARSLALIDAANREGSRLRMMSTLTPRTVHIPI